MHVVIIGAGIGGLTAAIALERAGATVTVCERAPALEEIGAGVVLWPNALHALDRLGAGERVRAHAGPPVGPLMFTPRGRVLQRLRATDIEARYGAPVVSLHRAELQLALADTFGAERVRVGHELMSHQADSGGVQAVFANGEVIEGDVLIGADGIRSVVRAGLLGDGPPRYRGDTAWRTIIGRPADLDVPGFETIGQGRRFGATLLSDDRIQWFAGEACPAGGRNADDPRGGLLAMFGKWHDPIPQLIEATTNPLIRTDLYDRPPARHLAIGRVALLGDAAHPMGPDLALGAGLAIEDGEAIASALSEATDVATALATWEKTRLPRVRRIARLVALIGAAARTRNPVVEYVRDAALAVAPKPVTWRQLDAAVGLPPRHASHRTPSHVA